MMQEVSETGDEKTGGNSHRNIHEEEGQTPQTTQPGLEDTVVSECFDF